MPATTGGDPGARAAALSARIGAEFDRRLDARLTLREPAARSPARGRPGLPADAVPGAGRRPRPSARVNWLPRQPLWFGIVIGSAVSGIAAVAAGVDISALVGAHHGGSEPYIYVNAAGEILAGLTVVWTLLLLVCIAHALVRRSRDRRRPQ
jgi:hypothetical protein